MHGRGTQRNQIIPSGPLGSTGAENQFRRRQVLKSRQYRSVMIFWSVKKWIAALLGLGVGHHEA
jgi:hypothetical protein